MVRILGIVACLAASLAAATLQRLSLMEMIDKSTAIARVRVGTCTPELRGTIIYTTCQLAIVERWKGTNMNFAVSVPGGTTQGVRQTFSGAPTLTTGDERVVFLWTGRSGPTQLIGLSQGLMTLERLPDGTVMAVRAPVRDRMLDSTGKPVWDEGVEMPLDELRKTVAARVGK